MNQVKTPDDRNSAKPLKKKMMLKKHDCHFQPTN